MADTSNYVLLDFGSDSKKVLGIFLRDSLTLLASKLQSSLMILSAMMATRDLSYISK